MKRSYVTMGYRNLTRRTSRTLLTLLGVVLAVGFTVGLLSISEGMMKSFDNVFGAEGAKLYVLPGGGEKMPMPMAFMCSGTALDENIATAIGGIQGVKSAEPVIQLFATKQGQGLLTGDMPQMALGVPPRGFFDKRPTARLEWGRALRESDDQALLAGWMMSQNMKLKPGDTLDVSGRTFKVVGALKRGNHPYDLLGYIPLKTAQRIREQPGKICAVVTLIDSPRDADPVKARIKAMFPRVDVQDVEQIVDRAKGMMVLTQAVHFAVSCFALFIGVLFVATTMIMSVSERVRELATLRVIGASRNYITKMIMAESLTLSLIGGALGCGLGFLLSKGIDHLIRLSMGETFMRTYVSPKIFLIALAISLLTGTFAGLLPVRMIMKKQLAESLRYE